MQILSVPHPTLTVNCQHCTIADLQPLKNWLDVYLQGNYFFREGHLGNILLDPKCRVYAVLVDSQMAGVCIVYKETTLHNLYLAPEYRRQGVGRSLIEFFKPLIIRSKSDQQEGDPTPAYERAGYGVIGYDPARPHIRTMVPVGNDGNMAPAQPGVPSMPAAPAHYQYQPGQLIPNHVPGGIPEADAARAAKAAEKEHKKKARLAQLKAATKWGKDCLRAIQQGLPPPPMPQAHSPPPGPGSIGTQSAPVTAATAVQPGAVQHPTAANPLDIWEGAD